MLKIKIIIPFILLFLSCNDLLERPEVAPQSRNTSVNISIGELDSSRTILPNTNNQDFYYQLDFNGPATKDSIISEQPQIEVSFPDGIWTVTVSVYNRMDQLVTTGSGNITTPAENSLSIPLTLTQNGTGSLELEMIITLPNGYTINNISGSLSSLPGSTVSTLTVSGTESPYIVSGQNISSGTHILTLEMTTSNGVTVPMYSDVVWIYDNILTSKEIVLSEDHFTSLPKGPSELSVISSGNEAILHWKDNATNESGFLIQRKQDGGSFQTIATINTVNIDYYTDSTVTLNEGYIYRILAFNPMGNSEDFTETGFVLNPTRLYVSAAGTGSGINWQYPSSDLQGAMDNAGSSSAILTQVWVSQGVYLPKRSPQPPSFQTDSPRYNHFNLTEGIEVYGGFLGNETTLSARDPWKNITTLSGDFYQDDIVTGTGYNLRISNNEENAYNVLKAIIDNPSVQERTILDGFTITGGDSKGHGGAIEFLNFYVRNCIFQFNTAANGGAIGGNSTGPTPAASAIVNCIFRNNISDQTSYTYGGGAIYVSNYDDYSIVNSVFHDNYAFNGGGAIFMESGILSIFNSSFILNSSEGQGGAISASLGEIAIANSIFTLNASYNSFGAYNSIYQNLNTSRLEIRSTILEPETDLFEFNNLSTLYTENIYYLDPSMKNVLKPIGDDGIWGTEDDGLTLQANSLAINAGDYSLIPSDQTDIDQDGILSEPVPYDLFGNNRTMANILDLGSVESVHSDTQNPVMTEVSYVEGNSAIELEWTDPPQPDFSHVLISWTPNDGPSQPIVVEKGIQRATINNLINGREYTFSLSAYDFSGNSSIPRYVSAVPDVFLVPEVSSTKIFPSFEEVNLSWSPPENLPFDYIEVSWIPNDGIAQPIQLTSETESCTIQGLTNGTNYEFTLTVVDFSGTRSAGVSLSGSPSLVIYVDNDATGLNNGSNWQNAYTDLSDAIDCSKAGNQIWVAEGTYIPSRTYSFPGYTNEKYNHFILKSGVQILGGFSGAETHESQRNPQYHRTILSGDFLEDDIITGSGETLRILNNRDNSYYLFHLDGNQQFTSSTTLDGLYLTGSQSISNHSGSIIVYEKAETVSNSQFSIVNCIFYGNNVRYGGNIHYSSDLPILIESCIFMNNLGGYQSTGAMGGAIFATSIDCRNSVFYGNRSIAGGALCISDVNDSTISNCSFLKNVSNGYGGALYLTHRTDRGVNLFLKNNIFWNNTCGLSASHYQGDTIAEAYPSSFIVDFSNCIYEQTASEFHPRLELWSISFTSCSNDDPQLNNILNPAGNDNTWGTSDDGLWFTTLSPLYNGGNSSLLPLDILDIDSDNNITELLPLDLIGNTRDQGGSVDIGPYELTP